MAATYLAQFVFLFCIATRLTVSYASPLDEMRIRVDQYKEKALSAPGCGFWREVLRLRHQVLQSPSTNTTVVTLVLKIKTDC